MSGLAFTCACTRAADVEGTSPCGRRATRREHGDPNCLGHWAIGWLMTRVATTEHGRRIWGYICFGLFVSTCWTLLQAATGHGRDSASAHPMVFVFIAPYFGALALAVGLERPLGGTLYMFTAPLAGFAMAFQNRDRLHDQLASLRGTGSTTRRSWTWRARSDQRRSE